MNRLWASRPISPRTARFPTRLQPAGTVKGPQLSSHDASMHAQAQRVPRLANLSVSSGRFGVRTGRDKKK